MLGNEIYIEYIDDDIERERADVRDSYNKYVAAYTVIYQALEHLRTYAPSSNIVLCSQGIAIVKV